MTFTYNTAHLKAGNGVSDDQHTVAVMRLRLGDVVEADPKLEDEELLYFAVEEPNRDLAIADAADAIAANYSHEASHSVGNLRVELGQRAASYRQHAAELRKTVERNKRKGGRFLTMGKASTPYNFEMGMHDFGGDRTTDALRHESGR